MDFYRLIKSLDELVFEVLSWLLFYPMTLWKVLRRPIATMRKVENELVEDEQHSFDEILGPPLFLALTLAIIQFAEVALLPDEAAKAAQGKFAEVWTDDKNLLAMRIVMFGALPLIAAVRQARLKAQPIEKSSLRSSVYAQCYAAAVFAILVSSAFFLAPFLAEGHKQNAILIVLPVALLWLGWVEARWMHRVVGLSRGRAFVQSFRILAEWTVLFLLIGLVLS